MTRETHVFGTGPVATVSALGAELVSLRDASGRDLLWDAGPQWPRHSPVLFPIVGKPPLGDGVDGKPTTNGQPVTLTQHGFARDRVFRWISRTETGCTLELTDDAQTRAQFPSAFRLRLTYEVSSGHGLSVRYSLHNPDPAGTLHASLGAHPAFRWPLREGVAKEAHRVVFDAEETAPIRRLDPTGLRPDPLPTPVTGRILALHEDLFADDAIIMPALRSHGLSFVTPDGDGLYVSWEGFRDLGLWMKPGAPFLCIEPWYGFAAPATFRGDFSEKPGTLHLAPGEDWHASWSVRSVSGS